MVSIKSHNFYGCDGDSMNKPDGSDLGSLSSNPAPRSMDKNLTVYQNIGHSFLVLNRLFFQVQENLVQLLGFEPATVWVRTSDHLV